MELNNSLLDIEKFEALHKHGTTRLTKYTLVQILVGFDQYRVAQEEWKAVAERAETFVSPYREGAGWFVADSAPKPVIALYDVAFGSWDEPFLNVNKRSRHSGEKFPVNKWLAAARSYNAQTKRIEKAMKGLSV